MMRTVAWVALAYLVGTIPSPYLLARIAGRQDLIDEMRRQDSPGDAHFIVAKKMSGAIGGLAIVLDILKGFVPALVARVGGEDPARSRGSASPLSPAIRTRRTSGGLADAG